MGFKRCCIILLPLIGFAAAAQNPEAAKTEIWSPEPPSVTPGEGGEPPSDAEILFDGTDLSAWESVDHPGQQAGWTVADGILTVKKGTGNIQTRKSYQDYQLHLEWRVPETITGEGQSRGNSGIFLASTGPGHEGYELQILDCYRNKTYVNGQAGSVYKQAAPLVNPCRKPGEWQSYDVIWTAPRFGEKGQLTAAARVTLLFNGVLVQNGFELMGETLWIGTPSYHAHGRLPIKLQDHPDPSPPVSFRSIWLRDLSR